MNTSTSSRVSIIASWLFGIVLVSIGILNMIFVHPAPGFVYLVLSLIYFPPSYNYFESISGLRIHGILKIILGILIMWGTLGVGDLAHMAGL